MARNVEVLLRESVANIGKVGDIVKVSPGYARNFLLPRKLAVEANEDNKRVMARRRARLDAEEAARAADFAARVAALQGVSVKTTERADEGGHLYGSVNAGQIAELLAKQGRKVEEKDVRLEAPIKSVGVHAVRIHVHGDMEATIEVVVEAAAS
jgi:large subunit ribosomal protein L9